MARTITPKVAALIERGRQGMQAGDFGEAARAFERALQQMPDLAEVHAMRADALMRGDRLEAALAAAERAVRIQPDWPEALMLRGTVEALLGRFAAAETSFRSAIGLAGPTPALQANLGNVLAEQERFAEALELYDAASALAPSTELQARRAKALSGLGRREEALQAWEAVLAREPGSLEAMEQLVQLYMGLRRIEALAGLAARALALAPEAPVFHIAQGWALAAQGSEEQALESFRSAAALAPPGDRMHKEAVLNEAMGLFKLQRWREGWVRYAWRLEREALRGLYPLLPPDPAALSAAAPLRIRIHTEQGIGDELFFLRFAPLLRGRGHRLTYRANPKLVPLLAARTDLFDAVFRQDEQDPLACDVELASGDLPLASGGDIAPPLPLAADPQRLAAARERLRAFGPPPYVGVTWRAGLLPSEAASFKDTPYMVKTVSPAQLGGMLRAVAGSAVILQRQPGAEDLAAFRQALGRPALDASAVNEDLAEALALLSLLDEYVAVSNANIHLMAGLAGRRARVLVQTPPEWRWGRRGDSPWFPGFVLYRQSVDRTWAHAISDIQAELKSLYR